MPRYDLVAARDGDILVTSFDAEDETHALIEARQRVAADLGADDECDCDGFRLEAQTPIGVDEIRPHYETAKKDRGNWIRQDGRMTKQGYAEAVLLLHGISLGLSLAGRQDISHLVFLASVRDAEELFNK